MGDVSDLRLITIMDTISDWDHPRDIFSRGSSDALRGLIQSVFIAECISPSSVVWIISAWISDIEVIDNRAGQFAGIVPEWPNAWVRLSAVVHTLLQLGAAVRVITNQSEHNKIFESRLLHLCENQSYDLQFRKNEHEHQKGIVTDKCLIDGSMNFTFSGIEINEEHVIYRTRIEDIAQRHLHLLERWGSGS